MPPTGTLQGQAARLCTPFPDSDWHCGHFMWSPTVTSIGPLAVLIFILPPSATSTRMSGRPARARPSIAAMATMAKKASAVAARRCVGTPAIPPRSPRPRPGATPPAAAPLRIGQGTSRSSFFVFFSTNMA